MLLFINSQLDKVWLGAALYTGGVQTCAWLSSALRVEIKPMSLHVYGLSDHRVECQQKSGGCCGPRYAPCIDPCPCHNLI